MIALVDCNNFYASCERLFKPQIQKLPVIVLSNNDGCVIARSNEAKALGVRMGAPFFELRELISKNNIQVFSSNYTLYGDISGRVMATLSEFTPEQEIYSIDECFLNLSGIRKPLNSYAKKIRATVLQNIGIPTCVGVAPSKTLAKSANKFAKKFIDDGVFVMDSEDKRKMVLQWQQVEDIWGVGRQYQKWLKLHNINTAWDFATSNIEFIRRKMGVVGSRMWHELNGKACIEWESSPPPKKAICTSRSFGRLLTTKQEVMQSVAAHVSRSAEKLRKQGSVAASMQVFIHTNHFRQQDSQYYGYMNIELSPATNLTHELISKAHWAIDRIFKPGYNYKKSGVLLTGIVPAGQEQGSLFDTISDRYKLTNLMSALDSVNGKYGRDNVRYAAQGYTKGYQLKREQLSPCYTTNLKEVCVVKT